jgi:hypothetical protein
LILSTIVFDVQFDDAIRILKNMGERTSSYQDGKHIGFNNLKN